MGVDLTGFGAVFDFGSKIVDKIFPDKIAQEKERAAAQLAIMQLQQSGDIDKLKQQLSPIITEGQSADPWTSRARPSFLYVMYIMILASIPMGILHAFKPDVAAAVATGMKLWLAAIPNELYTLFGIGYLGYSASRSWDKSKGKGKQS